MNAPRYPSLYQINTRVWLTELSHQLGKPASLDDIPDAELDRLAGLGFDWLWFLSVWQTGPAAQQVSRDNPEWRREFQETLPDLSEADIVGSGFAITGYTVHQVLGGDAALARLRERLRLRGLKLMLDWDGNWTNDCFIVFAWHSPTGELLVVAVNYAPNQSQCHVRLPFAELAGKKWQLQDQLSVARHDWIGDDLLGRGLYLDLAPWQACAFSLCLRSER